MLRVIESGRELLREYPADSKEEVMVSRWKSMARPLNRNQSIVLALLYFSAGPVSQFKRLKLATYGLRHIVDYKFDGKCYWGPEDFEFRDDLDLLGGYIDVTTTAPSSNEPSHSGYTLTPYGYVKSWEIIEELRADELAQIRSVAEDLRKSPDEMPVARFFDKYV